MIKKMTIKKRLFFLSKEEYASLPEKLKSKLMDINNEFDKALSLKKQSNAREIGILKAFEHLLEEALIFPEITKEMISGAAITLVSLENFEFDNYKPILNELIDAELTDDFKDWLNNMLTKIKNLS